MLVQETKPKSDLLLLLFFKWIIFESLIILDLDWGKTLSYRIWVEILHESELNLTHLCFCHDYSFSPGDHIWFILRMRFDISSTLYSVLLLGVFDYLKMQLEFAVTISDSQKNCILLHSDIVSYDCKQHSRESSQNLRTSAHKLWLVLSLI